MNEIDPIINPPRVNPLPGGYRVPTSRLDFVFDVALPPQPPEYARMRAPLLWRRAASIECFVTRRRSRELLVV
jgi:hypothetical protein